MLHQTGGITKKLWEFAAFADIPAILTFSLQHSHISICQSLRQVNLSTPGDRKSSTIVAVAVPASLPNPLHLVHKAFP